MNPIDHITLHGLYHEDVIYINTINTIVYNALFMILPINTHILDKKKPFHNYNKRKSHIKHDK